MIISAIVTCALIVGIAAPAAHGAADSLPEIDLFLAPQYEQHAARTAGCGFAGVAALGAAASIARNPALLHAWHFYSQTTFSATSGYGRGALFQKHIATLGAGAYASEQLSYAARYRFLSADAGRAQHEGVLAVSGRLFDRSVNQGAVDFGIALRAEQLAWKLHPSDFDTAYSLFVETRNAAVIAIDTLDTVTASGGAFTERRLIIDIGLFQKAIGENLDFGLVMHNLIGYSWRKISPHIDYSHAAAQRDTIDGDAYTRGEHTAAYRQSVHKTRGWINPYYRRLVAGIAFAKYLLGDKARINIPVDLEIAGLFDRSRTAQFSFRSGLELWVRDTYGFRFGYARAPDLLAVHSPASQYAGTNESGADPAPLVNANLFSGGAGLRIDRLTIDLYLRGIEWGLNIGLGI
jgi:hypothetical protein